MSAPASSEVSPSPAPKPRNKKLLIMPMMLLIGGGIAVWQVIAHRGLESTDNAQFEAEIVPVPSRMTGTIIEVTFSENQRVKKDDVLARLDDRPARARLAQAEASVAAAQAQVKAAEADLAVATRNAEGNHAVAEAGAASATSAATATRVQINEAQASLKAAQAAWGQAKANKDRDEALYKGGALAQSAFETSTTALQVASSNLEAARARVATLRAGIAQADTRIGEANARVGQTDVVVDIQNQASARLAAAQAQVEVAKATRDISRIDASYTEILAPRDGVISKKGIVVGQMVSPGQPVAMLVTDDRWITANFKETQLDGIRVGQPVSVRVDAFPDAVVTGHIESFAAATGARFALLPPDNATGNFTKVVQRVPLRVKLDTLPEGVPFRPGMSASVTVDTREGAKQATAEVAPSRSAGGH